MRLAGDDPEGDGSFAAGCLYAVLGLPLAGLTIMSLALGVLTVIKGGAEGFAVAVACVGMGALFGLLTGWCGWRLKYWYGTALGRRLDRAMDKEVGESARQLASASATAPTAVPTRVNARDKAPVRR